MPIDKHISPSKQRANDNFPFTQSFRSKTQKAIQIINKHQEEKYNFLKTLTNNKRFNPNLNKQDQKYISSLEIPQINLTSTHKVQLLPYSDQVYKISNPFSINTLNRSQEIQEQDQTFSQGTIPIQNTGRSVQKSSKNTGRSIQKSIKSKKSSQKRKQKEKHHLNKTFQIPSEYQGMQCKLKIYIKNFRGTPTQLLVYFQNSQHIKELTLHYHKYIINSEKIVHVNMQELLNKKWIYFKFRSKSQLSFFTFRVQQEYQSNDKKLKTEMSQHLQSPKKYRDTKLPKLQTSKSLKSIKSIQPSQKQKIQNIAMSRLRSSSLRYLRSSQTLQQLTQQQLSPSSKKLNKQLLQKLKKQQILKRKQEQQKKHQQIIQKKIAIQTAKQKQLKLRSKFLQMKKLLQSYKIIHEEQENYIKFLIPKLSVMMYLPTFHKICREIVVQRQRGLKMAWKLRMMTKKFTKIVKRKYKESIEHVRNRKIREMVGVISFTTLFAKVLHKTCTQKSVDVILSTVNNCYAGLRVNQSFDSATRYRRSIRFVQKAWLSKFQARMSMFQMYAKDQAQNLLTKYPYFKYVHSKFLYQNVPHTLSYKYMADESSKVKYLFEDYTQRQKQIQDFKQMNKKITQFNSTALKKRQKAYLQIPKSPCKPTERYFRNLSFLKSMIRGWFQLQYRKWSKTNKSYLDSLSGEKQRQKSPVKSVINKSSINSIELISPRKEAN